MKDSVRGNKHKIKNDNLGDEFHKFLLDACTHMVGWWVCARARCMSACPFWNCTLCFLLSLMLAASGQPLSSGARTISRWDAPIINANMSRFFMVGPKIMIIFGVETAIKAICGIIINQRSNDLHPTIKPVELVCHAIENSSKSCDIVLNSFGGSGTILIACEKLKRQARLIELDPIYVDVIVKRWEEFTGLDATHAGENKSFTAVAKKRQATSAS